MEQYIRLAVCWVPSILFALFVLVGFLRGLRRGFRKSLILLIQAIAAFVICLGVYLLLINNDTVDGLLLTGINSILGSPSGLQDALGGNWRLCHVETSIGAIHFRHACGDRRRPGNGSRQRIRNGACVACVSHSVCSAAFCRI